MRNGVQDNRDGRLIFVMGLAEVRLPLYQQGWGRKQHTWITW